MTAPEDGTPEAGSVAMPDPALRSEILAAVDAGFDAQLAFTRELVRLASTRGREAPAQDLVFDALAARGYTMDRWAIDPEAIRGHPGFSPVTVDYANAVNVVGSHRPRAEAGRSLILNGHVDVVPEGPRAMWTHPPYGAEVAGDWLHGRGAADMKAGLAANIFALDALQALGYRPAARVHLQSVTEEECTGNGALAALVRGYRADAALISEPMGERLVRANVGVLWFRLHVKGRPVHVREAGAGANAIEAAFPIVTALRGLADRWNAEKDRHPDLAALDRPISFNPGRIAGGDWPSSVPAWCTLDCRIALYPGWRPAEKAAEIEACVAEAAGQAPVEIEWTGFFAEGYRLEKGSEAERALGEAHHAAAGAPLRETVTPAYLDARVFALYGGCPALVYGPEGENIHGFDERVSLPSLRRVTGAIALFAAAWCGLERA